MCREHMRENAAARAWARDGARVHAEAPLAPNGTPMYGSSVIFLPWCRGPTLCPRTRCDVRGRWLTFLRR